MEDNLYALAYISRNEAGQDGSDMPSIFENILLAARRNNSRLGVTGALLFSRGHFAQVLEGPQTSIETIFETIQCDSRHRDPKILYFKPIEKRDFANWSMAFAGSSDDPRLLADVAGVNASEGRISAGRTGQDLVKILTGLINRQELASTLAQGL